jgi:hypothetical protein
MDFYPERGETKGFGDKLQVCRGEMAFTGANWFRQETLFKRFSQLSPFLFLVRI